MEALVNAFGDRAFGSAWGIPLETLFMEALVKFLWRQGLYECLGHSFGDIVYGSACECLWRQGLWECLGHSFGDIVYGSAREIPLETEPLGVLGAFLWRHCLWKRL